MDKRASFTCMAESRPDDWSIIAKHYYPFAELHTSRILEHLQLLDGRYDGYPVHRLEHSLQTATRAHRDGRAEDYVVMALLHDIGDMLGTYNHADISAAILKPFLSEELHWICQNHAIFQGYFYFHHVGMDRNMREKFRGHSHFDACATFCEKYDQAAFDADYDSAPLEFFEPMVRRVLAKPLNGIGD